MTPIFYWRGKKKKKNRCTPGNPWRIAPSWHRNLRLVHLHSKKLNGTVISPGRKQTNKTRAHLSDTSRRNCSIVESGRKFINTNKVAAAVVVIRLSIGTRRRRFKCSVLRLFRTSCQSVERLCKHWTSLWTPSDACLALSVVYAFCFACLARLLKRSRRLSECDPLTPVDSDLSC